MKLKGIFKPSEEQKGIKLKTVFINSAILAGLMSLMLFSGAFMSIDEKAKQSAMDVTLNDVSVAQTSIEDAKSTLVQKETQKMDEIQFNLIYNDKKLELNKETLGLTSDIEMLITDTYTNNKAENMSLEEKFLTSTQTDNNLNLTSTLDIDEQILYNNVSAFIEENNVDAVDAQATFNKATQDFTYTDSKNGTFYDANSAVAKIIEEFDAENYEDIQIFGEVVYPKTTLSELKKNTQPVSTFQTEANDDENRNTNIQLMVDALNGLKIESGQTLSINELVGERTAEKGFKEAPAIVNKTQLQNEIGGGICQVSGTLYNAALLANMEIVERVHHSFPSDYLPVGLDATLNWNNKDLKIKNSSLYPLYIGAEFKENNVIINVFGEPLPANVKIEIVNDILKTTEPGSPTIIATETLPSGVTKIKTNEQTGYDVEVKRNYYENEELISSEVISKDHFEAVKAVILKGKDIEK